MKGKGMSNHNSSLKGTEKTMKIIDIVISISWDSNRVLPENKDNEPPVDHTCSGMISCWWKMLPNYELQVIRRRYEEDRHIENTSIIING
jgi:hypothetical protein